MTTNTLTTDQQQRALDLVAAWLGPKMGHDGPAPTGQEAANRAEGPWLHPTWDWPGKPTPTILLEGGPYDWALEVSWDLRSQFAGIGVFAEPYAGYALCLYPA
ncbi:hypothetical protein [Pseudactinotalea terrae]|uniref:hypothetical protein n=1 Tax=Pseudactinotalea terrae TaxID=1743262 RepID=UPI0012E0E11F|nr:hypothetical protein [Pseudactinotalea terrae]